MPRAEEGRGKPAGPPPGGLYAPPEQPAVTGIEITAVALSAVWLIAVTAFLVLSPPAPQDGSAAGRFLMIVLVVFMPVAMIWVGATAARASRVMREESRRLQAAIDALRQAQIAQAQRGAIGPEPAVQRKLDEIAEAAKKTESALAMFQSSRAGRDRPAMKPAPDPAAKPAEDQGALPLGTRAEDISPPLSTEDFIRALNFPETAEDKDGFAALRRALKDRRAALLIRAAQDVLTLLSQDGIYMDDLRPDMAPPETWRRFAKGARGREVAALGGIRDRSSLALSAARMKQDPIFRDAVHHFLRRFDQIFAEFEATASDAEITALADTRTARAFMLLGRVAGTFD